MHVVSDPGTIDCTVCNHTQQLVKLAAEAFSKDLSPVLIPVFPSVGIDSHYRCMSEPTEEPRLPLLALKYFIVAVERGKKNRHQNERV